MKGVGPVAQGYVEDVEFLVSTGETAPAIAARLGRAPATLSRALYRAGRADLARPFERLAQAVRAPGVCAFCGGPCDHKARSCWRCAVVNLFPLRPQCHPRTPAGL